MTGLLKSCATPLFGLMLAPVCVIVGTRFFTSVPNGTVSAIVFAASFTVPVTFRASKSNAVIALAGFSATVTVTVYAWVELSAAFTV
ncbi:hypothetical protein D3C86_2136560 [compost metagenome]